MRKAVANFTNYTDIDIFRVAEGKIMEHWDVLDLMGMMQQLGAMPE